MSNGIDLIHYKEVGSTNKVALEYEPCCHLTTVMADVQTSGRGRIGRDFYSYTGGLYMSVMLDPAKISVPVHLCTPIAAIVVKNTLKGIGFENVGIKWVNDILCEGKKVCGILTETKCVGDGLSRIVVGIGINLSRPENDFPDYIKNKASYLEFDGNRECLALKIAELLGQYVTKDRGAIVEEYKEHLLRMGDVVTVTDYRDGNKQITGRLIGVNEDCFLKLEMDDGSVRTVFSGEIME